MTAKNKVKTDSEIASDVAIAMARAQINGTNWVDSLPDYIERVVALDVVGYVGSLADGRAIYRSPHTMRHFTIGAAR